MVQLLDIMGLLEYFLQSLLTLVPVCMILSVVITFLCNGTCINQDSRLTVVSREAKKKQQYATNK